jgi:hypothetical protein
MGNKRTAYWVLVGNPEENKPVGRLRCIWDDNIKIDFTEIGWGVYGLDSLDSGKGPAEGSREDGDVT